MNQDEFLKPYIEEIEKAKAAGMEIKEPTPKTYRCRFCGKWMKETNPIYVSKENIPVGRTQFYVCFKCGLLLQEKIFDYSKKQIQEMFGE